MLHVNLLRETVEWASDRLSGGGRGMEGAAVVMEEMP